MFKAVADLVDEREFAIFAAADWVLVRVTQSIYEIIHAQQEVLVPSMMEQKLLTKQRNLSSGRLMNI